MIKISIDNKQIKVEKGTTVLQAANMVGIRIPNLCYHENLPVTSACRLCLVEIDGAKSLMASCSAPVVDGMKVFTDSERVINARRMVLELLLSDHPDDCEKSGSCELQDYAREYHVEKVRFTGEKRKISLENGDPFLIRDYEKCILCGRCVRACQDVMGISAIEFANRGFKTKIATTFDIPLQDSTCVMCGNCIEVCPVGALREKQAEGKGHEREYKKVRTTCPYCGVGCNIELNVVDNKVVKVTSWKDSPVNSGWLCVKGKFGFEFINHPDRLKKPLIKKSLLNVVRGFSLANNNATLKGRTTDFSIDNSFVEISWEEALTLIADKLKEIKEKHGPDSIAGLASAKCTNEENYLFQKFIRAVIGTNNVDHCARLCHAPTVAGLAQTFGSGAMTNSIEDLEKSDCFIVIGSNTTETHPIISLKIKKAVMQNDAKLIVIDPREIPLCDIATLHLKQKPGSDVAVINSIMQQVLEMNLHAQEFINNRTEGFEKFKKIVSKYTPEESEKISTIPADLIKETAKLYGNAKRGCIIYSMGITQHTTGTDNVLSIANLAMLTGNVGKAGSGVNPLRGQNNVQGACDMGALPNVFSGYQSVGAGLPAQEKFEDAWKVKLPTKPGLTVIEIMKQAEEGKIKALYIMGENPMLSDPDVTHVEKALKNVEFLVVQDIFLSETAKLADVVLPSCSFAEKEGTYTNTERRVQLLRKAINAIGDSKSDWKIICELSEKLGYKMDYDSASDIMDEIAGLTPIYAGMSFDRLKDSGLQWPCPNKEHPGTKILHTEKFSRGLGKFIPAEYKPPHELPDKNFPLILTTGRLLYHYHTGTMTRRVEGLNRIVPGAFAELNLNDASASGIKNGDKVKVITRRGEIEVTAKVTDRIMKGVIFIPFHFVEAAANVLTNPQLDPVSKIPEYKVCAVRIQKLTTI